MTARTRQAIVAVLILVLIITILFQRKEVEKIAEKIKYGTKEYQNKLTAEQEKLIVFLAPYFNKAIKYAENDKYFGIRPKPATVEEAEQILNNSIYNNFVRWIQAGTPGKYIDYMRKRWAPLKSEGATNDPNNLNVNWAPNTRDHLQNKQ
jgi:hypothetical protein